MNDENYVYIPIAHDKSGRPLISHEIPATKSQDEAQVNQAKFQKIVDTAEVHEQIDALFDSVNMSLDEDVLIYFYKKMEELSKEPSNSEYFKKAVDRFKLVADAMVVRCISRNGGLEKK